MTNNHNELSAVELDFYLVCELFNYQKSQQELNQYECTFNGKTIEYAYDDNEAMVYITDRFGGCAINLDYEMLFDDFNEYKSFFNNRLKPLL
jgi:hypothetical protein